MTLELKMSQDTCIAWAKIALARRQDALEHQKKRREISSSGVPVDSELAEAMENEFQESMQAVVAAAICLDALYDHLWPHAGISEETRKCWMEKRTARAKQIKETMRSALKLNNKETGDLAQHVEALFKLRDLAVHPSNDPNVCIMHAELKQATEWRFATFRGDVADIMVCKTLLSLWDAAHRSKHAGGELDKFQTGFKARLIALLPKGVPEPDAKSVEISYPDPSRRR